MFNYREPGRNLVLEGENSLGQSWYDGETTMFLEYPDNWWWMFWTRVATLGQLWDYTIYHDEIRESPTPGLFIGLTYLYPCACPHRLANAHRGGCTQFVWLTGGLGLFNLQIIFGIYYKERFKYLSLWASIN